MPIMTNITYILCLLVLLWFTKARDYYRKLDNTSARNVQVMLQIIAIIDLIMVIIADQMAFTSSDSFIATFMKYPWINAFIRPVLMTLVIRTIRAFWGRYLIVIKGSLPMVLFIITYVFYFSWMGNRLFSGTIEGVQSFSTLPDAFFYMVVLLTTSNYPDVMMPSYSDNRMNAIFFITFLIIGLFLLMNLLLAIFYAKYQERADDSIDRSRHNRNKFFYEMFIKYDKNGNGYITKEQTYDYIKEIDALVKMQD